jgi:gas vesicle protein
MRAKFIKGMTTGAIIGAAAGMMLMPTMDRGTRRRVKRSTRAMRNTVEDMYDSMRNFVK